MTIYFAEWNADYEKYMINSLKHEYDVVLFNKLMKHFRTINFSLERKNFPRKWFIKLNQLIKLRKLKPEDILLCSGFGISGFIDLVKDVNCHRVLVLRDTIDVLNNSMKNKKKWLRQDEDFISKITPHFDKIYSFDFDDCKKYHFIYLNQFLPFSLSEMKKIRENTFDNKTVKKCFFIGEYWKNRVEVINKLAPILQLNNYETDFNLINYEALNKANATIEQSKYYTLGKKISYFDNIEKVKQSDIILEIVQIGQTGVTLRAIEAILFNKKLITTNKSIKKYDFYNANQIFILDDQNDQDIINFLHTRFTPVSLNILYQYSADAMLTTIKNDLIRYV
ncbi:hypothetical protein J3U21_01950 [Gilliamella sp. B2776]|uniref:hypothetical protein n=2 Tax=Gilliamella TaxID=1193503 RepID=UPI00226A8A3F|nr:MULTISPECIES: hypothetical protein [unclassified Gilliamella]MCX8702065.1 hypothetical protein [Gilliamella sp. B2781]MCX8649095.1 hypothetical protein [Gilliamella sp. B2779]MCX8653029.1 hypothetical protein [Gilliamella sp. B2737]MCX8664772.1 hypothetical protein [Gilliamella sp. B2887]MCX8690907.1 hypothetical protein [Gilliamella sp. B2776]